MNNYLKVKGHEKLYRDPFTGAIINTETPNKQSFTNKFNAVVDDINNLKDEVFEIKSLLKELIRNVNH